MSLRTVFLALLLTGSMALQMHKAPTLTCSADECIKLLDDIHHNKLLASKYPHMVRNLPEISTGLSSLSCRRGSSQCELTFGEHDPAAKDELDFFEIAKQSGTDKVTAHHYHPLYQKWLGKYSKGEAKPFTFVEVGFATGTSAKAWSTFLPHADVHEIEVSCDADWNKHATSPNHQSGFHRDLGYCKLHCGDAGNMEFLETSLENVTAPLVAVDDGGHGPAEMQDFFRHMWPKMQPGGLLFVEDLAESYVVPNGGGFVETYIKPLVKDLMEPNAINIPELSKSLMSMECREQICVFQKKYE